MESVNEISAKVKFDVVKLVDGVPDYLVIAQKAVDLLKAINDKVKSEQLTKVIEYAEKGIGYVIQFTNNQGIMDLIKAVIKLFMGEKDAEKEVQKAFLGLVVG